MRGFVIGVARCWFLILGVKGSTNNVFFLFGFVIDGLVGKMLCVGYFVMILSLFVSQSVPLHDR